MGLGRLTSHQYWVCEGCGKEMRIQSSTASGYGNAVKERKQAGWRIVGPKLLCPVCQERRRDRKA